MLEVALKSRRRIVDQRGIGDRTKIPWPGGWGPKLYNTGPHNRMRSSRLTRERERATLHFLCPSLAQGVHNHKGALVWVFRRAEGVGGAIQPISSSQDLPHPPCT